MGHFAEMPLLAGVIAWAAVGLAAAYLAHSVTRSDRALIVWDSVAGMMGAVIGGLTACVLVSDSTAVLGSVGAAFLGAWASIMVARTARWRRV